LTIAPVQSQCSEDVLAVKLVNDQLDSRESLDEIFYTDKEEGFQLTAEQQPDGSFRIDFGSLWAGDGDVVGDGGEWKVVFDENGGVPSVNCVESWIT
jgi:hypothetical protein